MADDPNMKCVCGFRSFRESVQVVESSVERWVYFDDGSYGGFGSTPYGTYFGSGAIGQWGLFEVEVPQSHKVLACKSCARTRSDVVIGGVGVFGSYILSDSIFIVVTDASLLTCMRVRFHNDELGTFDVSPTPYLGAPLPLAAPAPAEVEATPPPGEPVAAVLRARFPGVDGDGTFVVSLVDVCGGTETLLTNVFLESAVQVHLPSDADLNGIPEFVREFNLSAQPSVEQPASGSMVGIPFDKCDAVIEYDSRFGQLPLAAGWTEVGSGGTFSFTDGGVLAIQTDIVAHYFQKEIVVAAAWEQIHFYASFRTQSSSVTTDAKGFILTADGAEGLGGPYRGIEMRGRADAVHNKTLTGATVSKIFDVPDAGWVSVFAGMAPAAPLGVVAIPAFYGPADHATLWGLGALAGPNPTLRLTFGDTDGSSAIAFLRNVVASAPGRFMRAFFRSYAAVTGPTLRLYLVSDVDSSGETTARFRVRYGTLAAGTSFYNLGSAFITDVTATFNTRNVIIELPAALSALPAQAPFWFSVERVWDHADDLTRATIHLVDATVRSA